MGSRAGRTVGSVRESSKLGVKSTGVAVDVREHLHGDAGDACLGVAHGRRRVVIYAAEVALSVNEWVAEGEVLCEAHHGVVDGGVAVGVVFTEDFTNDTCALPVGGAGAHPHLFHGIQDAAVDGLEAVPDIREGAGDDDAHCVVQIGATHLVFDFDGADGSCSHHSSLGWRCLRSTLRWTCYRAVAPSLKSISDCS